MSISEALEKILEGTKSGFLKWRADENGFCETFLKNGMSVILEPGIRFFQYQDGYDFSLYFDNGKIRLPLHTFEEWKPELCWVSKLFALAKSWICPLLRKLLFIKTDWNFKLIKEERARIDKLIREIAAEVTKVAEVTIGQDKRTGMFRLDDHLYRQFASMLCLIPKNCSPEGEKLVSRYGDVTYTPWIHPSFQTEFDPSLLHTLVAMTGIEVNEFCLVAGNYENTGFPVNYLEVAQDEGEMKVDSDLDKKVLNSNGLTKDETLLRRGDVFRVEDYLLETTMDMSAGKEVLASLEDDVINLLPDEVDNFCNEGGPDVQPT